MSYLLIEDFRGGLDTRKFRLTLPAGTVTTLQDLHLTAGGELEKRKAFVRTLMPSGTYGLEATDAGLETYGTRPGSKATTHRARSSNVATITLGADHGFVIGDQVTLTGMGGAGYNVSAILTGAGATTISFPNTGSNEGTTADAGGTVTLILPVTGAVYVRLQHPAVQDGATYDATYHAMSSVKWSQAFNGSAFVAATYTDNRTFLFFDGHLVRHSSNGIVLRGWTTQATINDSVANSIALNVTAEEWVGSATVGDDTIAAGQFFASNLKGATITSPDTVTFEISGVTISSTAGSFGHVTYQTNQNQAAIPGTTSFTVNATAGTPNYVVYAPKAVGDLMDIYLTGSTGVGWAVSNNDTATAIAAAITARNSIHGFTASALGAVVTITNPSLGQGDLPRAAGTYSWGSATVVVTGGTDAAAGAHAFSLSIYGYTYKQQDIVGVGDTWAIGDTWSFTITTSSEEKTIGKGNIAGQTPTCGLAYKDRVFMGINSQFNFCAVGDPTGWETQNLGAGFVSYTSHYGRQDTVNGFAPYQGNLAVIARRSVQIWEVDPDPENFRLIQTLNEIGTFAPESVRSVGDFDTIMLADTGFRSMRVRDSSGNAVIADVGVPIDELVQDALSALTETEKATACSIVDPSANRFWGFVPGHSGAEGKIFVFSFFPSSGVSAWSTYRPTYFTGQVHILRNNTGSTRRYWLAWVDDVTKATQETGDLVTAAELKGRAKYIWSSAAGGSPSGPGTAIPNNFVGNIIETSPGTFTFTEGQTAFVPQKFVVYQGRIYVRDANAIYTYGGADNEQYDQCIPVWDSPFLNTKTPATRKDFKGANAGFEGTWRVSIGTNTANDDDVKTVYQESVSSWDRGGIPFARKSTHIKTRCEETSSGYARFANMALHFEAGEEK